MTTVLDHADKLAASRRAKSLDAFTTALESSSELKIPDPVIEIRVRERGKGPTLSAEAFELARKVYYLQHGSRRDAARAIIAMGLSDTDDLDKVDGRLKTWWKREEWPLREMLTTFALRDANADGGLFRSGRKCPSVTTGNGAGPAGQPCNQSPLNDSDFCPAHDPRPEYVARREATGLRLAASRRAEMVPVKPFADWCDESRRQMLADARARGEKVHSNSTGLGMLAAAMQVDPSQLIRLFKGITSRGVDVRGIKASTIVKYLEHVDDSFEDIYGFPPPPSAANDKTVCPECGGSKNVASEKCRPCFDAVGARCVYRNRRGEQCPVTTEHESGHCHKCRLIVFRERRPRTGRASYVSVPMLTLATGAYLETPKHAIVARRMWAANAAGVRDVFANSKALTGSLVKRFAKFGWTSLEEISSAHEQLVREHGAVEWPDGDEQPLEAAGLLPSGPYVAWLRARFAELGSYAKLADRLRVNPDNLSCRIRGVDESMIRRATVDRALEQWGDGTTFDDLYGEMSA